MLHISDFTKIFESMMTFYGKSLEAPQVSMWYSKVSHLNDYVFRNACDDCMLTERAFPTPGTLLQKASQVRGGRNISSQMRSVPCRACESTGMRTAWREYQNAMISAVFQCTCPNAAKAMDIPVYTEYSGKTGWVIYPTILDGLKMCADYYARRSVVNSIKVPKALTQPKQELATEAKIETIDGGTDYDAEIGIGLNGFFDDAREM